MNKYKLIKPGAILAELNKALEDDALLMFESKACISYWKNIINNLTVTKYSDYITWENIERFENIHYLEAIFLLLNLPTRFLLENKEFDLFKSFEGSCFDEPIRQVFSTSVECIALERSYQETPHTPYGDEMIGHYQVKEFVGWAIDMEFIQIIEDNSNDDFGDTPLGKYNDYRGWAKVHNTIATLVALEAYDGKLSSNSSILNNDKFYNNLSKNLVPKKEDGIDKPKPKTLENYISKYNNFNK
jgi:hypothetical protein